MKSRPNILFVQTDQQKASATGPYGNHFVNTPCWNRLAAEGVTFENAYATSPICTPSRATVMTGVSPLVHRVFCHQNHVPDNLPQLQELLHAGGYHCLAAGHYEEHRGLARGWDEEIGFTGTPALERALRAHYDPGSREVGWSSGVHSLPPEESHAAVLTDEVLQRIDLKSGGDKPWFIHVAYVEPHAPYFAPVGFEDRQDPDRLPLPPRGPDADGPAWQMEARDQIGTHLATPDDIRRCVAAYYNMIEYADQQIQRLLDGLEERGLLENTWVIACSDHGDYTGEKGLFTKTESPYECLLHVPLIIRSPGGAWNPGKRITDLVELTDLFATMLALGDCEIPNYAQGHDLIGWLEAGHEEPLREALYSAVGEYGGDLKTTMPWGIAHAGRRKSLVRGVRNQSWSYVRDPQYGDEGYDLTRDPHELRNVLQNDGNPPPEVVHLQKLLDAYEESCDRLFKELDVRPGDRNFVQKLVMFR